MAASPGIAVRDDKIKATGGPAIEPLNIFTIFAATLQDASFWTGLVTVFAFAQGRFSEKHVDADNIDPPLPARYFTSRFRYVSASLVFSGCYVLCYVGLIVAGSFPGFQEFLKPLFGTVGASAGGQSQAHQIGTPAWAAMALMVIAPTVPWIRRVEGSFRQWLQDFSDTPFKARQLAEEIIESLLSSVGTGRELERATDNELVTVFRQLESLRHSLTASGRTKRGQRHRDFYVEHADVVTGTINLFQSIETEINSSAKAARRPRAAATRQAADPAEPLNPGKRSQMINLIRRLARLIACALLYAESEEVSVRKRLQQIPYLAGIAQAKFQFTIAQILIAIFLIALVAIISGPLTSAFSSTGELTPTQIRQTIQEWSGLGFVIALSFVMPMFLVAAIRLYLIDLKGRGHHMLWPEHVMILLLASIGCYGLAAAPWVAFRAYEAGQVISTMNLTIALLYALPSAICNVALVMTSDIVRRGSLLHGAVFDFVLFGCLGGVTSVLVASLISLMRLEGAADFNGFGPFFWIEIPFVVAVALVSGVNGALQCAASRVVQPVTPETTAPKGLPAGTLEFENR
jgi:hypothetical protein